MADSEDIIIIEDEDVKGSKKGISEKDEKSIRETIREREKRKRLIKYALIGAFGFFAFLIMLILVLKKEPEEIVTHTDDLSQQIKSKKLEPEEITEIHRMITKANILYDMGNKKEALDIFDRISSLSESTSNYNLGVLQMSEKNYESALESFKKALNNEDDRCISAINAGVCAYKLNNLELFKYYIDLAYTYLPNEAKSPLYSYYYGLINYYKGFYYEAISPLTHKSSNFYEDTHNHLLAKLHLFMDDEINAIKYLERTNKDSDALALGLLYARVGEYDLAKSSLLRALSTGNNLLEINMALALVNLKMGDIANGVNYISKSYEMFEDKSADVYPISVKLRESLFDINIAQKNFIDDLSLGKGIAFKMLFYFAPYKIFNIKENLDFEKSGEMNIYINEKDDAMDILSKSAKISQVNLNISNAIRKILEHKIREANDILTVAVTTYPKHSILHYNLALSYAQLGDYENASKHFTMSYHLNTKNHLAGVFAMISLKLLDRDYAKLYDTLLEDLGAIENPKGDDKLAIDLMQFNEGSLGQVLNRLNEEKVPNSPIDAVFDTIIAISHKDINEQIKNSQRVLEILPKDIVAHILYLFANYNQLPIKEFAKKSQEYLKSVELNFEPIYYGSTIAREFYIDIANISGLLYFLKQSLQERMLVETKDVRGIMQSLGLINIYLGFFEEAFTIYNKLIDDFKERDAHTLFLAATSAIGAGHKENAIALLELARLTDKFNLENRYALGLLYQEVRNLKATQIQYRAMGSKPFESKYFDFDIAKEAK